MSGQCLSPSGGGHALTPPRHRRLGEPLPHQLPSITSTGPQAADLYPGGNIRHYPQFPMAIPDLRVHIDALLPRLPLSTFRRRFLARLACLIHAANVHSEPGSNPSIVYAYHADIAGIDG